MNAVVARKLICPFHERLLSRPTFRYLRELQTSQWTSPDGLRELQRRKLADLLRHAANHTPFYRRRFRDAGVNVISDDPFDCLAALPLLDKHTIRAQRDDLTWPDAPGGLHELSTGGSTGEPLRIVVDRRRQAYDQAARARSHNWFGVRIGDPELYLWGSPIEPNGTDRIKRVRDWLFNHRLLDAFEMSPERMDDYLDEFDAFRPVALFGYPSSIALLVAHARRCHWTLDTSRLRAVFVTGEVCLRRDRESIAEYFGVPVADGYGSRDGGFIAHECPLGSMHITAENVVVEVFDGDRPVESGASGEIVVTHLDAYAMPLVRYRTGDVGRLRSDRCACGRGLPVLDVVEGRVTDMLHLPDGTAKHALCVIYPLRELPGIERFRVVQGEDYGITIEIVRHHGGDVVKRQDVARAVRSVLGEGVDVRVSFVDAIAACDSGKHRYVVSHVSKPRCNPVEDAPCGPIRSLPAAGLIAARPKARPNGIASERIWHESNPSSPTA